MHVNCVFVIVCQKGKCLFDGVCKIDVNTRRFCPYCRLEKCFAVGMKKEFILSKLSSSTWSMFDTFTSIFTVNVKILVDCSAYTM